MRYVTGTPLDHGTSQGLGMSPDDQESMERNHRHHLEREQRAWCRRGVHTGDGSHCAVCGTHRDHWRGSR